MPDDDTTAIPLPAADEVVDAPVVDAPAETPQPDAEPDAEPVVDDQGDAEPVLPTDMPADAPAPEVVEPDAPAEEMPAVDASVDEAPADSEPPAEEPQTIPVADPGPDPEVEDLRARIAELEAQVEEKEAALAEAQAQVVEVQATVEQQGAYIDELEADPYRAPASDDQGDDVEGVVTPQLTAYEELTFQAEQQAWERATGLSYDDTDDDGNPLDSVDEAVQALADGQPTTGDQ